MKKLVKITALTALPMVSLALFGLASMNNGTSVPQYRFHRQRHPLPAVHRIGPGEGIILRSRVDAGRHLVQRDSRFPSDM